MGIGLRRILAHVGAIVHHRIGLSSGAYERNRIALGFLPPAIHPHIATNDYFYGTLQHTSSAVGSDRQQYSPYRFLPHTT